MVWRPRADLSQFCFLSTCRPSSEGTGQVWLHGDCLPRRYPMRRSSLSHVSPRCRQASSLERSGSRPALPPFVLLLLCLLLLLTITIIIIVNIMFMMIIIIIIISFQPRRRRKGPRSAAQTVPPTHRHSPPSLPKQGPGSIININ